MVSFKNLFIWGLTLASTASVGFSSPVAHSPNGGNDLLEKRVTSSTLQYSQQGRFLFLLNLAVPQFMIDSLYHTGTNIAEQLAYDFKDWARNHAFDAYSFFNEGTFGGVWSQQATGGQTFGILFQHLDDPDLPFGFDIGEIRDAFVTWASQAGGTCQVTERANNFIDLAALGANPASTKQRRGLLKERTRVDFCPTGPQNVIQYGTSDAIVGDTLRYTGIC